MKFTKLMPGQIAITMDDKEFKALLEKQLSPKLLGEGYRIKAIEGPSEGWLIMLRKEDAILEG